MLLEAEPAGEATLALLDAAWAAPRARTVGVTGPPGVGKSTLLSALIAEWRGRGLSVAVLAVDPSSRRSGGAILGDRTRLDLPPEGPPAFVRSLAARDRLGGTASLCPPMLTLLAALFDVVLVETVGVGQSETDVTDLVEAVVLAVQPASGDTLQFIKAGIAEIPDVAAVTKADLGAIAERAARDLEAALDIGDRGGGGPARVLLVAAPTGRGVPELAVAALAAAARRATPAARERRARAWVERALREELGRRGLEALRARGALAGGGGSPFRRLAALLGDAGPA